MLTIEYKIKKIERDGVKGYKIYSTQNPHVSQHHGLFSTLGKAKKAMKTLQWGDVVIGDVEG